MFLFLKDKETYNTYTNEHTLSRIDALPISPPMAWRRAWRKQGAERRPPARRTRRRRRRKRRPRVPMNARVAAKHARSPTWRSEEHTSELQSLMRTSYAVFCLQNKRQCIDNTYQHQHSPPHSIQHDQD